VGVAAAAGASGVPRDRLTRDALFIRFGRVCFPDVLLVGMAFLPTSADTSSVQQTRRPARPAGILIACFDIATVGLP
jgi:hypothetical protein